MAQFKTPIYFCCECKKVVGHIFDLLFIDEHSHKGFCSEECIEDFYFPLIKYYEMLELSVRKKLHLEQEVSHLIMDEELVEEVVSDPSEIYRLSNELDESYYHFIKHYADFSGIVVASAYRKEASFIYLSTKTKSKVLLDEFRHGERVTDWGQVDEDNDEEQEYISPLSEDHEVGIDADDDDDNEDMIFIQLLESKKSKILADVLMKRKDHDIPFEDYSGYESCFQETLDSPDEVFEKKDNEGDVIFTYIKSFSRGSLGDENFFYIVTCLKRSTDATNVNVYPILALPTIDLEMCQEFSKGVRLSGPLKN